MRTWGLASLYCSSVGIHLASVLAQINKESPTQQGSMVWETEWPPDWSEYAILFWEEVFSCICASCLRE